MTTLTTSRKTGAVGWLPNWIPNSSLVSSVVMKDAEETRRLLPPAEEEGEDGNQRKYSIYLIHRLTPPYTVLHSLTYSYAALDSLTQPIYSLY